MKVIGRLRRNWRSGSSAIALFLLAGSAFGSLCVWRSPDEDIAAIYEADGYKTVFEDISDSRRQRIEERLGTELDPDETQFKFFPVFKGDEQVGTVMTHAGKGQFGAIEVVVAVASGDTIPQGTRSGSEADPVMSLGRVTVVKAVRIQRDREKAKQALRSGEFLGQFEGMTVADQFQVGEDLKPAIAGAERASQAVATAVRKLLIVFDEFYGPKE
jgi:hypothetical protein